MKRNRFGLQSGALWKDIIRTSRRALEIGALKPILTDSEFVRDGGFDFLVRIILNLERKAEDRETRAKVGGPAKEKVNPFLPYEQDMFVADISDTHVCLLNKFNVIDHHLLVVTRAFEDQEMLLTVRDFEAILACMAQFEGLAFYNGGEAAG
ncbi:MAG: phosphorylase, partial [bacterium]|nr:phosphorylase [bacterium]